MAEIDAAARLAIAALVGLAVGLEREWSGHASGPNARFAGLRTFLLLGLVGGIAGLLLDLGFHVPAGAVIAGAAALSVAAYLVTARRRGAEVDGTTEAAALVVVAIGALAGRGWLALSAGAGSAVVLALREKTRLHWLVRRLSEVELHAALQFAFLALVVLPLLPRGPFWGVLGVRPRSLWTIVLLFSALNACGFLARRAVGPGAGYTITGMLGGLISSTAVTLDFSRRSRADPALGAPLAYGVLGACTVLLLRVVVVTTALNTEVGPALALLLVAPALVGAGILFVVSRAARDPSHETNGDVSNPLRLGAAIPMAIAFQVGMSTLAVAQQWWGQPSLYPAAAALGLTDVDALTVSVSRTGNVESLVAARAIAVGVIANTVLKAGVAATVGSGRYRRIAVGGLVALGLATAAGLLLS